MVKIPKYTKNGKTYLNIACGTRMNPEWNNLDFSPYARLRKHLWIADLLKLVGLLSEVRYRKLKEIDKDIIYWDVVKRGYLPFDDNTFDAVYHCHFIEHIEYNQVLNFLSECLRILKVGGIIRIVFPDLYQQIVYYLETYNLCTVNFSSAIDNHLRNIENLLHQLVANESTHNIDEKPVVRFLERIIRGNPKKMGWSHRWMYDKFTMQKLLSEVGFQEVQVLNAFSSNIPGFHSYCLDIDKHGIPHYSSGSLFMEAIKK